MAAKKHQKNKKITYVVIMFVLFVIAAFVVYLVWEGLFADKKGEGGAAEVEKTETVIRRGSSENGKENDSKNETNDGIDEKKTETETEDNAKKPKIEQYDGDAPNVYDSLSGVITYAGVAGNKLIVRVNIDQYLEDGRCELSLLKNDMVAYSSAVNLIPDVTTSTCEGFDVPLADLGENGLVKIKISIASGDKSGVIWGETNI